MLLAMIYPDKGDGGRGKEDPATNLRKDRRFSQDLLTNARSVLAFSRPLAETVITGTPLNEALARLKNCRQQAG